MNKYLLIFLLCICSVVSRPLDQKRVVWAINAGSSKSKRASQAFIFSEDKDFDIDEKTVAVDYSLDQQYQSELIKYTEDPEIYKSERHSYNSFHYYIPLPKQQKDGKFVLILKFCEMYFTQANKRVFNIKFGDDIVVKGLDVAQKVGRFTAYDEYIEFEYKQNAIFFKGRKLDTAIKNGKIVLEFEKTEKDNPFVHGLILYQGGLHDTDFFELQMYKEQWEKKHRDELRRIYIEKQKKEAQKMKRKEKIKLRNDHLDDMEEDYEDIEQAKDQHTQKREIPPLRELLMTPFGVVAMIGFSVSSFVLIYFTFFDPYGIKSREKQLKNLPSQVSDNNKSL